jgi:hypothetical protein
MKLRKYEGVPCCWYVVLFLLVVAKIYFWINAHEQGNPSFLEGFPKEELTEHDNEIKNHYTEYWMSESLVGDKYELGLRDEAKFDYFGVSGGLLRSGFVSTTHTHTFIF